MSNGNELGRFLRSRRSQLSPEGAGIEPRGGSRRVPGLKREEVALLVGVSPDYYARMEQGRVVHLSSSVLDALSRALQLNDIDRVHLQDLARSLARQIDRDNTAIPQALPGFERILPCLPDHPSFVTDWRLNVLLANDLALAFYLDFGSTDPAHRNFARFLFTEPAARGFFANWSDRTVPTVGTLRRNFIRHPDDPAFHQLIDHLRRGREFDQLWRDYTVSDTVHAHKLHHHPVVGDIWLDTDNVTVGGDLDQVLTICTAEPGSPSEAGLHTLAHRGR